MKTNLKNIFPAALLFFTLAGMSACGASSSSSTVTRTDTTSRPPDTTTTPPVATKEIKGKLIRRSCASIVVQVLDAGTDLGENGWSKDGADVNGKMARTNVYDHVFAVKNVCDFPASIKEGDEITFILISDKDIVHKDCAICMMYDNPPAANYAIRVKE